MISIDQLDQNESQRREEFPSCRDRIFLAHAAIAAIPQVAISAMDEFNRASATGELDYGDVLLSQMDKVRESAAKTIKANADEIALIGPTSTGLSLVANGISWKEGDEIITYLDDYPANVYPWKNLEKQGVKTVFLRPDEIGELTPELVEKAITPQTRMFALASCNFLTGYRIDIEAIGKIARDNGILFCLDAIQTVGAFETSAKHVDFMSADSHKWMLGPLTAGIFYVDKSRFETLAPSLLGAWNVKSPNFIAQDAVDFEPGGRRYEPGVLNVQGLLGMKASIDLLLTHGIEAISERLLDLKSNLSEGLEKQGFKIVGPKAGANASSITAFTDFNDPGKIERLYHHLHKHHVAASFRHDREGIPYIRFSAHYYNTHAEIDRALEVIESAS